MPGNRVRITAETVDKASSPLDKIKDKFEGLQKQGAKGFGIGVAAGATTFALNNIAGAADQAASAVIGFAQDSISKASDLNETMSKAEVIFGDNASAVEKWAATMATAGGQSKTAALDAASGFAGLFKTVGLNIDQSTVMSEKLTQMGADLASFFNTDVGTALDALKSGLNGESEPLRQFNVFLSDTAVASKLASMGIKKVGGQFTEAQKATARYQLILDQTGDAQGDFARTGDGLANSQRTLTAEMDNLQAEVGQELLPVMKDMTVWAKNDAVPALHDLIQAAKDAGPVFDALGVASQFFVSRENAKAGLAFGEQIRANIDATLGLVDAQTAANQSFRDGEHEFDNASKSAWTFGHATDGAAQHAEALNKGQLALSGSATALHHAYAPVIVDVRSLTEKLDDATAAIEDDMFAVDTAKRSLQEYGDALKDDEDRLKKLEAIKHPTRAQREDINQTKDAIVEDKKKVIEASLKLLSMGKITFPNLVKRLQGVGLNLLADTDAARQLRNLLYQIDSAAGGRAGSGGGHGGGAGGTGVHRTPAPAPKPAAPPPPDNGHGNAAGGPVAANMPRLVGEKGPELFTPESNGRITPNSNTMLAAGGVPRGTGAGASITINGGLHLHGIGSDVSPAAAEHFGRRVIAEVASSFQQGAARRGLSVAVRP